jgi:hypothetical protein
MSHAIGLATALLTAVARLAPAVETLFVAEPFTPPHAFTPGIEGPACDREGAVFAVNYARQGTIGRVAPDGSAEVHLALPGTSIGNGIRFAADGTMFIADYVNHNVLKVSPGGRDAVVFAHEPVAAAFYYGLRLDRPEVALAIGDKVRLIPGHCDPTVNLHDWFVGVRNGRVESLWPVSGRGPGF